MLDSDTTYLIVNQNVSKGNLLLDDNEQQQNTQAVKKKSYSSRNIFLDSLKSISSFLVVMTHTVFFDKTTLKEYSEEEAYKWFVNAFYTSFVRCANALFMMVTGILILHPKHLHDSPFVSMKMFAKRSLNYLVWGFLYYLKYMMDLNWKGNVKKSFYKSVLYIIDGGASFWYLYTLLFIHLATPFFQAGLRTITRLSYEYCLISYFVMYQGLNGLRLLIDGWGKGTNFSSMTFYLLAGPFVYGFAEKVSHPEQISGYQFVEDKEGILKWFTNINWKKPWARVTTFFVFIGTVSFMYLLWSYRELSGLPNGPFLLLDHCPFNTVATLSFFLFMYGSLSDWQPTSKPGKLLYWFFSSTGSCTMGIYMLNVHVLYRVIHVYFPKWLGRGLDSFNPFWFALLIGAGVYLVCWVITLFAKKIPGVRFFFQ